MVKTEAASDLPGGGRGAAAHTEGCCGWSCSCRWGRLREGRRGSWGLRGSHRGQGEGRGSHTHRDKRNRGQELGPPRGKSGDGCEHPREKEREAREGRALARDGALPRDPRSLGWNGSD